MAIYGNIENVDAVLLATVTAEVIHVKGADGVDGKDGTSITISNISESTADGGTNTVTFSDGSALNVKNGSKGSAGADGRDGAPGAAGPAGAPGIYYGTTQPTGDTHPVWIDPSGDQDEGSLLPAVTATDNGKFLRVVSGAWAAVEISSANGVSF